MIDAGIGVPELRSLLPDGFLSRQVADFNSGDNGKKCRQVSR
jgi:hypothetical protein